MQNQSQRALVLIGVIKYNKKHVTNRTICVFGLAVLAPQFLHHVSKNGGKTDLRD